MLHRLAELVEAGATLIGQSPVASLGLKDDSHAFSDLVARLWKGGEGAQVGKGHVYSGADVERALAAVGVTPDFRCAGNDCDGNLWFVHRHIDDGEIYFVGNRLAQARNVECRIRVHGKLPQIGHADSAR